MVTEPTSEIRSEVAYFDLDYLGSTLGQFNNTKLTIVAGKNRKNFCYLKNYFMDTSL